MNKSNLSFMHFVDLGVGQAGGGKSSEQGEPCPRALPSCVFSYCLLEEKNKTKQSRSPVVDSDPFSALLSQRGILVFFLTPSFECSILTPGFRFCDMSNLEELVV